MQNKLGRLEISGTNVPGLKEVCTQGTMLTTTATQEALSLPSSTMEMVVQKAPTVKTSSFGQFTNYD